MNFDEKTQEQTIYAEAQKYLATLAKSLDRTSRFGSDLRYGICTMCFEKLLVAYIAWLGAMATHHVPTALYRETMRLDPDFPAPFEAVAQLVGRFENICSFDGFGYQKPSEADIRQMILGLIEIDKYIGNKMNVV